MTAGKKPSNVRSTGLNKITHILHIGPPTARLTTPFMKPRSLDDIECFLLDLDGTFYLGDHLIDGSLHFLVTLGGLGKDFIFLTNNSSNNSRQYADKITRMGVPIPAEKVFTSGEATALRLSYTYPHASLFIVGTPALEEDFRARSFILTGDRPEVCVLGFDTTITYQKLWQLCDYVRAGLPYIATHPDLNCPTETGYKPDIGAMIAFVKASTGREPDEIVGKPNHLIVDAVSQKYGVPLGKIAVVGDRLYTDILLGHNSGITSILVLSGETRMEDLAGSAIQPSFVFANLGALASHLITAHTR